MFRTNRHDGTVIKTRSYRLGMMFAWGSVMTLGCLELSTFGSRGLTCCRRIRFRFFVPARCCLGPLRAPRHGGWGLGAGPGQKVVTGRCESGTALRNKQMRSDVKHVTKHGQGSFSACTAPYLASTCLSPRPWRRRTQPSGPFGAIHLPILATHAFGVGSRRVGAAMRGCFRGGSCDPQPEGSVGLWDSCKG